MAERARLLMLTPRLPYPVVGGDRLRIYHIARTLAEHVDLTLVSLVESREELNEPVDGVFREVHRPGSCCRRGAPDCIPPSRCPRRRRCRWRTTGAKPSPTWLATSTRDITASSPT